MKSDFSIKELVSLNALFPFQFVNREKKSLLFAAWFFFMYTIFSGAVRKWVVGPGAISNAILFGQLIMYYVFFIQCATSKIVTRYANPTFFFIFLFYLLLTAFNPMNNTIYHGILGLVIHLGIWTGLIAYYRNRSSFELEKLTAFFILILIGEVILASLQYSLPSDNILNITGKGEVSAALVGDSVRVSGTFNYLGGFQVMVTFFGFVIWFLIVLEYPVLIITSVFALAFYAALMSGSRSSLVMFLFVSAFAFILTGYLFKNTVNLVFMGVVIVVAAINFGGSYLESFEKSYDNFAERVEWGQKTGESSGRISGIVNEVLNFRGDYPIFGIGLGSTYQGAIAVFGGSTYLYEYGYIENELTRIILEGGFILFFFRIILLFVMLKFSFIPTSGKLVILVYFLGSMVVFNVYQGVFFLFGLILVDRAYFIKAREKASAKKLLRI